PFSTLSWLTRSRSLTSLAPDLTTIISHNIFKPPISKKVIKDSIHYTAMSANGQKMALLTKRMFRVFDSKSASITSTGYFANGGQNYMYSDKDVDIESQTPLPAETFKIKYFSCVAVSNEYLAIGSPGRLMIFIIEGPHAGRWV